MKILNWLKELKESYEYYKTLSFVDYERVKQFNRMTSCIDYYRDNKNLTRKQIKKLDFEMSDAISRLRFLKEIGGRKELKTSHLDLMESYYKDWKEIVKNKITSRNLIIPSKFVFKDKK